jgi:hypothetical protein
LRILIQVNRRRIVEAILWERLPDYDDDDEDVRLDDASPQFGFVPPKQIEEEDEDEVEDRR